ncbi:hypothetical protein MHYP_G00307150 [Metynnis hypsauchen]
MESVMGDLKGRSCFIYIVDIVVYSASVQQHHHHLQEVFDRLHRARLMLNMGKCNLLQTSLHFLGHVVSKDGISMEPGKIEAVNQVGYPAPGVLQVLVPTKFHKAFLQYAHDNPLSCHLGQMKTLLRLLEVAYWPSVRKDVWAHCRGCETCQKYKPRITKLDCSRPDISVMEPGYMLAVDLMGPLPNSL